MAPRPVSHDRIAGKFRLGKRLATGGMGEVWVARNEATGADVALKLLRRGDADPQGELRVEERFRHEAMVSAMLSHRSIVKVFDLIEEPTGLLVLVMELLRGETLQSYLQREGPRSERQAVAIVCPILSALHHAHARGVVHRDVTPSNIFLAVDPDGHVTPKLVDFGIAKFASGGDPAGTGPQPIQTMDGRVLGTPRYMAPERIRGTERLDGRADIFSVGVVLYEILTGASPFAASGPSASLAAVLERPVDPDPRIGPKLWIEIRRAIAKPAYERHGNAQELAVALRAAVGETEGSLEEALRRTSPPVGERPDDLPSQSPPRENRTIDGQSLAVFPRRRIAPIQWAWASAAMMVVAVGALLIGMVARSASDRKPAPAANPAEARAAVSVAPPAALSPPTSISTADPGSGVAGVPPANAPPAPATLAGVVAPASARPAKPNGTMSHKTRSTSPVLAPKSIATTPGF